MNSKKIHYLSGLMMTLFVGVHLFNHIWSIYGAEAHIQLMTTLRRLYRNTVVESILLLAVMFQIYSGVQLVMLRKQSVKSFFDKLQIWSGLYMALFLIIHVSAVLVGRVVLKVDTNFCFGTAGINSFPVNLFFVPYYALAIIAFFGHISSVHNRKMQRNILGLSARVQSKLILIFGILLTVFIFYGLTNHFEGVKIPAEYHILTKNQQK